MIYDDNELAHYCITAPSPLPLLLAAAIARKGKKVSERDYGDCRREVSEALPRLWRVLIKR